MKITKLRFYPDDSSAWKIPTLPPARLLRMLNIHRRTCNYPGRIPRRLISSDFRCDADLYVCIDTFASTGRTTISLVKVKDMWMEKSRRTAIETMFPIDASTSDSAT